MDGVQLPQGYSHFEEAVYFLPFSSQKFLWAGFENAENPISGFVEWSCTVVISTTPLDHATLIMGSILPSQIIKPISWLATLFIGGVQSNFLMVSHRFAVNAVFLMKPFFFKERMTWESTFKFSRLHWVS